jgi:zinc transport system substrate-binding protein
MRNLLQILLVAVAATLVGAPGAMAAEDRLEVVVSILPQQWFVEQIGGPEVTVSVLVGPGHSPATFEPTPKQLARLQRADLFVASGVPFERGLVPRIAGMRGSLRICGPLPDAAEAAGDDHHGHDHHGHHHHDTDPHTWLDPAQARQMARTISKELSELSPEQAALFARRLEGVEEQLTRLENDIRQQLAPFKGARFFVFHPAFGHFAAAFGLEQIAVEDQGHEPGARQLARVIDQAKQAGATAIIVQPQFSQKSASTVAEAAGLEVVVLDPLSPDYLTNLRHIATTLADLFARTRVEKP